MGRERKRRHQPLRHGKLRLTPAKPARTDPHLSDSEWRRQKEEREAIAAEAQRAWEEKARADAEAWAKREAARGVGGGSGGEAQP